jgi:hypothetical protein
MALARIRTHFPEEVIELQEALIEAGYQVETIRLDEFRIAPADLELTVEKLPVVEAWRHLPNTENVYVAPGTPESLDIRSSEGAAMSREPRLARFIVEVSERSSDWAKWATRQRRELTARIHEIRERWTPPREYQNAVHLEPVAPSSVEHPAEPRESRIDLAIEQARLQQEALRERKEAEQRELQEQARLAEESRRRAREAAEARALLAEQQKIEAMVRATQELRERVVVGNLPKPRLVEERRKPRRLALLRTRRERAVFRAGVAAFVLAFGMAFVTAEALHPRSASGAIPQISTTAGAVPFAKPASASETQDAAVKHPSGASMLATTPVLPVQATGTLLPSKRMPASDVFTEVIVRKPHATHPQTTSRKGAIAHYSDLD